MLLIIESKTDRLGFSKPLVFVCVKYGLDGACSSYCTELLVANTEVCLLLSSNICLFLFKTLLLLFWLWYLFLFTFLLVGSTEFTLTIAIILKAYCHRAVTYFVAKSSIN